MAQILVRQLNDAAVARLKTRARASNTSVEAIAREAIHKAAKLSADERRALIAELQAWGESVKVPGVRQTPAVDLIREDRDR